MSVYAAKKNQYYYFLLVIAATALFSSCTVKNYPINKPFVYETNINIEGKYSTEQRKVLKTQLQQQLHDSVKVRWQRKFLVSKVLDNPPVYDSLNVAKTKEFMSALLNSLGYYRDSIIFTDTIKQNNGQQRAILNFNVIPGKQVTMDSIWYDVRDSNYVSRTDTLQKITEASLNDRMIKNGDPFSKPLISAELDRLSDVYRNNGYLRFTRDQLIAVWDTVGRAILAPTFDPVELARRLEAIRLQRENPTADLEIRLKPEPDPLKLTQYYIGNVKVYPDFNPDTSINNQYTPVIDSYINSRLHFISYRDLFKTRKLIRFVYLRPGELYRQSEFLKTQNKFNALGAWRLVSIDQIPRPGEDTVDFEIRLTPADRYSFNTNFEVSRNTGNILSEGSLVGLGLSLGITDRNFARVAAQANTNARYGIELGNTVDDPIQTRQITLSNTIHFPRELPRNIFRNADDRRTFLTFNVGSTYRKEFYEVTSVNSSWGYEARYGNKLWGIRFPNIEYNFLDKRQRLIDLIDSNLSYQYIFSDGLILSSIVNLSIVGGKPEDENKKSVTNVGRFSFETSGLVSGLFKNSFLDSNLYRFIKVDAEFTQTRKIRRTAIAWRTFVGIGYELPSSHNRNDKYLPFFRQYYAGGPNSMRAWTVRKLGPGSTIKSFDKEVAPDRFGDIRLEANIEYRYHMVDLLGFPLEGALFTDMGNVWFLRKNDDFPNGEFRFDRLWKDLAIGVGTGFRYDFGFLKLRLDFAWKAKDPSPAMIDAQNKWFYKWRLGFGDKNGRRGAQFQLGINYPF
jgi:outer membrane protein insertion porin family